MCHVVSRNDGTFTFPMLSPGKYCVVPYFEEDNVKYIMEPKQTNFEVTSNSVELKPIFVVSLFDTGCRCSFIIVIVNFHLTRLQSLM